MLYDHTGDSWYRCIVYVVLVLCGIDACGTGVLWYYCFVVLVLNICGTVQMATCMRDYTQLGIYLG